MEEDCGHPRAGQHCRPASPASRWRLRHWRDLRRRRAGSWITTAGRAEVDLGNGNLTFTVKGLVLADDFNLASIGTPRPLTKVKGTLVCNDTEPGFAELVDTEAVPISADG